MVNMMLADELIKSTEKILSSFDKATKEMAPYIERIFDKINRKNETFDTEKGLLNRR
ncbi:MAG: hypothetical protein ACXVB6_21340 [Mucilaginibacter sp.]